MKSIRMFAAASVAAGAALVAAALPATPAGAEDAPAVAVAPGPGGHPGGPGHEFGPMRMYGELGLSPAQKADIQAIFASAAPAMKALHEQARANEAKLRQTSPDDPNYASVSAEVSQTHGSLESQMLAKRADVRAKIYAVLTPAQKTQLTALEAKWQAEGPRQWSHHPDAAGALRGPPPPDAAE
jgi:Spy/CpxP family protein refolding chaperone